MRTLISLLLALGTGTAHAQVPTPQSPVAPSPTPAADAREQPTAAPASAPAPIVAPTPPPVPVAPVARPYAPTAPQPVRSGMAVQYRLPQPYVSPPARPRRPRRYGPAGAPFALALGPGFMWRNESAHRVFTSDASTAGVELLATYDVWAPGTRTVVAAGLGGRFERLGDDELGLWHRTAQAELVPRFRATRWLWPQVRLAVGVVSTRFRLDDTTGFDFEDRDVGVVGSFGGGFTLRTPTRALETYGGRMSSLSLGVSFDAGYSVASSATLRAKPAASGEVPRATFSLGDLARSGAYFRVLAVVRF